LFATFFKKIVAINLIFGIRFKKFGQINPKFGTVLLQFGRINSIAEKTPYKFWEEYPNI